MGKNKRKIHLICDHLKLEQFYCNIFKNTCYEFIINPRLIPKNGIVLVHCLDTRIAFATCERLIKSKIHVICNPLPFYPKTLYDLSVMNNVKFDMLFSRLFDDSINDFSENIANIQYKKHLKLVSCYSSIKGVHSQLLDALSIVLMMNDWKVPLKIEQDFTSGNLIFHFNNNFQTTLVFNNVSHRFIHNLNLDNTFFLGCKDNITEEQRFGMGFLQFVDHFFNQIEFKIHFCDNMKKAKTICYLFRRVMVL